LKKEYLGKIKALAFTLTFVIQDSEVEEKA